MKMRNPIQINELVRFYYIEDEEEDCCDGIVRAIHDNSVDIEREDKIVVNIWLRNVYKIVEMNPKNNLMAVVPVV